MTFSQLINNFFFKTLIFIFIDLLMHLPNYNCKEDKLEQNYFIQN